MRQNRLLALLVALLLAVGLSASFISTAEAKGLPKHEISQLQDKRVNNHKFIITGKVSTLPSAKFKVLKRKAKTHAYKSFASPKTRNNGRFRFTVTGNLGDCFHVEFPGTAANKKTTLNLGCIHTA